MSALKLINMQDVEVEEVKWLIYPFIPYGKITIIQGDPGEGKTTLVLQIIARLTKGESIVNEEAKEPINVIYQTAEDGLADTIKPRLLSADADCSKVLVIDDKDTPLTMRDVRLEQAIVETKAKAELPKAPLTAYDSIRVDDAVILSDKEGNTVSVVGLCSKCDELIQGDKYPSEADLHKAIYNSREDIGAIIHSQKEAITAASKIGATVKPFLDDFAQIVGVTVKCAEFDANDTLKSSKKVVKALGGKSRNAVLIKNNGAVCCGPNKDEAGATEMVMEKNCKTYLAGELFGGTKSIGKLDSVVMNVVYRLKYSKQK